MKGIGQASLAYLSEEIANEHAETKNFGPHSQRTKKEQI